MRILKGEGNDADDGFLEMPFIYGIAVIAITPIS
jgi:hypothetical protein